MSWTFYNSQGQALGVGATGATGAPGGTITVEDEGTPLATDATTLNFTGAGVTATGAGVEKTIDIPGGAGIAATLFDAKGDLIAASAADTAARLAAAANGASLVTASGESTGLKWRLNNDGAAVAPAVTDDSGDGYSVGSRWLDTTADKEYVCLDASVGAAMWIETTATGGGGGGRGESASKYNPDHETPATAVADQEEFNEATGMAWTAAPATADIATYPGFYRLKGDTTERHLSKAWTPGAVDVTLAAKFSLAAGSTLTGGVGIYLGNATGNPADMVLGWFELQNVTAKMSLALYNENTSTLAQVGTDLILSSAEAALVHKVYLRLTRVVSGPTWTAYASFDGITWYPVATTGSKALTIGAFGLRFATNQDIALDWVRVWNSVVTKVGG